TITLPPVALDFLSPEEVPLLSVLIVAGGLSHQPTLNKWISAGRRVFNAYGPTETTVCASVYNFNQPLAGEPPVGYPIANTRLYILDKHLNPVPVGVPGELYIAGAGLARGYLQRPELTAEKFIADPFSKHPGERMYASGDLARYLPEGSVEFMGRLDHQVKIRGFRIETGEIAAFLLTLPQVVQAVVFPHKGSYGEELVAWLVGRDASEHLENTVLRRELKSFLPDYMIPAHFVWLEKLPLTVNGKVDREALPAPDLSARSVSFVAPRTATEEWLVQIWCQLLNRTCISTDEDFFALGGHSLLAVQLLTRINQHYACALSLSQLFINKTIMDIAQLVDKKTDAQSLLLPLRKQQGIYPVFLLHPGDGGLTCYRQLVEQLAPDYAVYGIQSAGQAGVDIEPYEFTNLCHHYAAEIEKIEPHGPYRLAGWSSGGLMAHTIATLLARRGAQVEWVFMIDPMLPSLMENRESIIITLQSIMHIFLSMASLELDNLFGKVIASQFDLLREWVKQKGEETVANQLLHGVSPCPVSTELVQWIRLYYSELKKTERLFPGYQEAFISAPVHICWAEETLKNHPQQFEYWRQHTACGYYHTYTLKGGHHTACVGDNTQRIASVFNQLLKLE
ncbi:MAG: thioesterase domain-containing protein, partial [Enterobacteriaceae bacterium]